MEVTDYGHLYIYFFPVVKYRNPSEYVELIFAPQTESPIRRVLLQDVRLPDSSSIRHHHVWGVVDRVYNRLADAESDVREDGGSLIADGPYSIIPEEDESFLAFEFAIHDMPPQVMSRMRLKPEGMYRLFVSHPGENRRLALERPEYSDEVIQLFGDRRRIPIVDRRLIDRVHAEFQLAAESQPIPREVDGFLHAVDREYQPDQEKSLPMDDRENRDARDPRKS
jgi:hypothetical protein